MKHLREIEELKYSAEEKIVEDSESEADEEELAKRTVAERRQKIEKRLSVERQIPPSTQKKEIVQEITEIKRQSFIEDKKAIHEEEILQQMPTDTIIKSTSISEQIMKLKSGKIEEPDITKSDFDKELYEKFKTTVKEDDKPQVKEEVRFAEVTRQYSDDLLESDKSEIVTTAKETVTEIISQSEKIASSKIEKTQKIVKEVHHTEVITSDRPFKKITSEIQEKLNETIDAELAEKLTIQKEKIDKTMGAPDVPDTTTQQSTEFYKSIQEHVTKRMSQDLGKVPDIGKHGKNIF